MTDFIFPVLTQGPALWAFCFVLGLLIGSFLNVVILRLPKRLMHDWRAQSIETLQELDPKALSSSLVSNSDNRVHRSNPDDLGRDSTTPPSLVFSRSHCPQCKAQLSWYENIPLFSFLMQGGKCRHCKGKISWQYPLVELATGILSVLVIWKFGPTNQGLMALIFTWFLVAASGIDLRTQLLPDQLTLPLLWLGLLISIGGVFVDPTTAIIGAAAGYMILWLVYWGFKLLTGKDGMGFGDFKLLAALGAWCGYQGLVPILLLASLTGAVIGSVYLAVAGKGRATPIPFGQWLALGGWIQLMFGSSIVGWYFKTFMPLG